MHNITSRKEQVRERTYSKGDFGAKNGDKTNSGNTKLIEFLKENITNEKYSLVVSSSQSAQEMIIQNGESVMTLGGFSGSDNILILDQFKKLVKNGEVRYVLTGGNGSRGNGGSEIMNWVTQNGEIVSENEYKDSTTSNNQPQDNIKNATNSKNQDPDENSGRNLLGSGRQNSGRPGGGSSEQLYDLKGVADTLN